MTDPQALRALVEALRRKERREWKDGRLPGLHSSGYVAAIDDVLALIPASEKRARPKAVRYNLSTKRYEASR
jgi:hypothetical protein